MIIYLIIQIIILFIAVNTHTSNIIAEHLLTGFLPILAGFIIIMTFIYKYKNLKYDILNS